MAIIRLAAIGAAGYGLYKWLAKPKAVAPGNKTYDGLAAIFSTREQADSAVEHLVQEHRVDRSLIFIEPVGDRNTAGNRISGGDAPSGQEGSYARRDAPLNGALRVSVAVEEGGSSAIARTLKEMGGEDVTQL